LDCQKSEEGGHNPQARKRQDRLAATQAREKAPEKGIENRRYEQNGEPNQGGPQRVLNEDGRKRAERVPRPQEPETLDGVDQQ
jgi:hypothetical protein